MTASREPSINGAPVAQARSSIVLANVCVYCGSSSEVDPLYFKAARTFGRQLAENGLRLIYGGGGLGLMGALARGVNEAGGKVTGIIPDFLVQREFAFDGVDERIVTADMHERKLLMAERADAFVALPGGIGTVEELAEQMTWAQLSRHNKPILIANIGGYWTPFLALLDHMRALGFLHNQLAMPLLIADEIDDILPMLRAALHPAVATNAAEQRV